MRRCFIIAIAMAASSSATACSAPDAAFIPLDPCERRVADAADAIEPVEQVALLDEAIFLCDGLSTMVAAIEDHPGLLGVDSVSFLGRRCSRTDQAAVATSPVCTDPLVRSASSEPTDNADGEVGYLGLARDGSEVLIMPSTDVTFIDGRPRAISAMVDIAVVEGCAALLSERDRWAALIDDTVEGQQASVFARHGDDLAAYLGCA